MERNDVLSLDLFVSLLSIRSIFVRKTDTWTREERETCLSSHKMISFVLLIFLFLFSLVPRSRFRVPCALSFLFHAVCLLSS